MFYYSNEYYPADSQIAPVQDLRKKSSCSEDVKDLQEKMDLQDTTEDESHDFEEEKQTSEGQMTEEMPKKKTRRAATKYVCLNCNENDKGFLQNL